MLVLSRKENERIVFPQLGITISLLNLSRSHARVGIDAPKEVTILRGELEEEESHRFKPSPKNQEAHHNRNLMNTINLHVMLYQQQLKVGLEALATRTLMKLVDFLDAQSQMGEIEFAVETAKQRLNGHVMIVEDDPDQCELLKSYLAMQGLQVSAHEDGAQALRELRNGLDPSVILMDWNMGKFGGAWLSTRVAEEFGDERPRLFVLSGTSDVPASQMTFIDAWLAKPLNHELLFTRLKAIGMTAA